jgi:hypothetical protein
VGPAGASVASSGVQVRGAQVRAAPQAGRRQRAPRP